MLFFELQFFSTPQDGDNSIFRRNVEIGRFFYPIYQLQFIYSLFLTQLHFLMNFFSNSVIVFQLFVIVNRLIRMHIS